MSIAIYAAFFGAVVLVCAAAALSSAYLVFRRNDRFLGAAWALGLGGCVLLGMAGLLRAAAWGKVPLTEPIDFINLFLFMVALAGVGLTRSGRTRALLAFYLPPVALLALLAAAYAVPDLGSAPKALPNTLLIAHVTPAILAYGLFFTASLTSIAYVFQARRLKQRSTAGLFQKLPSLENLDRTLYTLIGLGYPVFVVTLTLGLVWAWLDRALLSPTWWLSPKIFVSGCMVVFYAFAFHGRQLGRLRGPKLAYTLFVFGAFLAAYLVLKTIAFSEYNFWVAAQ
jgi:HemX protein